MNSALVKFAQTMDSREIAELTGKDHRNVTRDIVEQLGRLDGGVLRFEHTYRNEQNGQEYRCYRLPYRETMILVSGYSVELRARVIDRWMELEKREHDRISDRKKSAKIRLDMTAQWKLHGAEKPHHFINLTYAEYRALGYDNPRAVKKDNMDAEERARLAVLESIETLKLTRNENIRGYAELSDSVTETGRHLPMLVDDIMAPRRVTA